ncbi:hypothetical protein HaLaN_06952 [Haematococcus lacustris]|uniref:Uncharacterized protein n=1 Tax=Haematococcus lacustris TaxID=44745 RepID=A0A699YMW7_HAELA|nr:hypothetical protein HaLaN_06952 [Haematococcus lacustris]
MHLTCHPSVPILVSGQQHPAWLHAAYTATTAAQAIKRGDLASLAAVLAAAPETCLQWRLVDASGPGQQAGAC